ncbi:hypothetical protein J6590_005697 [Homalodisca vitripennis]|nr:hypothetical protein J6590_005697 [Homalodisca vitripennis]
METCRVWALGVYHHPLTRVCYPNKPIRRKSTADLRRALDEIMNGKRNMGPCCEPPARLMYALYFLRDSRQSRMTSHPPRPSHSTAPSARLGTSVLTARSRGWAEAAPEDCPCLQLVMNERFSNKGLIVAPIIGQDQNRCRDWAYCAELVALESVLILTGACLYYPRPWGISVSVVGVHNYRIRADSFNVFGIC